MNRLKLSIVLTLFVAGMLAACGGGSDEGSTATTPASGDIYKAKEKPAANPNGIGPVEGVELAAIDPALAAEGEAIFTQMCTACHKMDKRHVGPALTGVVERRNPAWIMNMILNPEVMVKEDPVAKGLLAEYLSPMANQNLTEEQARAVLEYFRHYDESNK